jgi:PPOX class probable F420-dependent enzyme
VADSVPPEFTDLTEMPIATIGTVGADGRPQLSEVWFLYDEGEFKVSLNVQRQKTRNLRRNNAVSLFILDLQNTLRYLEVRGDAELAPDEGYQFADKVGAKYGGVDIRQMDGPGGERVVVTIRPARIVAVDLSRGVSG